MRVAFAAFLVLTGSLLLAGTSRTPAASAGQKKQSPERHTVVRGSPTKPPETFWEKLLRITGISATPRGQKGPGDQAISGEIWVLDVKSGLGLQVTSGGGYRSPIFLRGDKELVALQGTTIVRLPRAGGAAQTVCVVERIVKLVGFSREDPDRVLFLVKDEKGQTAVGLLSMKTGSVIPLPYDARSDRDRRMVAHLEGWERVYGARKVYVRSAYKDTPSGPVKLTNVYLKQEDGGILGISESDDRNCSEPSLSESGRFVAYVRSALLGLRNGG